MVGKGEINFKLSHFGRIQNGLRIEYYPIQSTIIIILVGIRNSKYLKRWIKGDVTTTFHILEERRKSQKLDFFNLVFLGEQSESWDESNYTL